MKRDELDGCLYVNVPCCRLFVHYAIYEAIDGNYCFGVFIRKLTTWSGQCCFYNYVTSCLYRLSIQINHGLISVNNVYIIMLQVASNNVSI